MYVHSVSIQIHIKRFVYYIHVYCIIHQNVIQMNKNNYCCFVLNGSVRIRSSNRLWDSLLNTVYSYYEAICMYIGCSEYSYPMAYVGQFSSNKTNRLYSSCTKA